MVSNPAPKPPHPAAARLDELMRVCSVPSKADLARWIKANNAQRVGQWWKRGIPLEGARALRDMSGASLEWLMEGRGETLGAYVRSSGWFELEFPYQEPQFAKLVVRRHPRHGLDVMVQIERGQFLCGIDGCEILARFDDGEAKRYSASEPADNSSETIFINDAAGFLKRMKAAKRVRIEAGFFHNGSRTLDFNVSDFNQAKFDGKRESAPAPAAPSPADPSTAEPGESMN